MLLWFEAYCEAEDMSRLGYVASPSRGNGFPQPQVGQLAVTSVLATPPGNHSPHSLEPVEDKYQGLHTVCPDLAGHGVGPWLITL